MSAYDRYCDLAEKEGELRSPNLYKVNTWKSHAIGIPKLAPLVRRNTTSVKSNLEVRRVMLSTLRRRVVAAFACLTVVAAVVASTAGATNQYYHTQNYDGIATIAPGYPWVTGPPHTLTANTAAVANSLCIGAIEYYGGTLVGDGYCGSWPWGFASHPYCACALRDPAVYPNGSGSGIVGDAYESY